MPTLIIDIETIGENFDSLDQITKDSLTHWLKRESDDQDDHQKIAADVKERLGFSPLTGEIVAIGVLDAEQNKGAVYYQAPGQNNKEEETGGVSLKQKIESEMLQSFWEGAKKYDTFVTFNGRGFDVPYIMVRSAIHRIKPTKNLMSNRYASLQRNGALHLDLIDQLSFYGAVRQKGSLHLWCRAFGIKSPKADGVTGSDVAALFKKKQFLEIARYNIGDLRATRELYHYWKDYLNL